MILTCTKCKKEKPETDFYVERRNKTGRKCICRLCCKAYQKAHRLAHIESLKVWHKAHRKANIDKIKARNNDYYKANKEKCLARNKVYREQNKEKKKAMDRAYHAKNREKHLLRNKAYQKAYRLAYPEKARVRCRKRRALKRGNAHEPYTEAYIFERDNWICGICGRKINRRLKRRNPLSKSIDHIIPLSKGGSDSPINVQAAHLRCNMLKQAQSGGQLRLIG